MGGKSALMTTILEEIPGEAEDPWAGGRLGRIMALAKRVTVCLGRRGAGGRYAARRHGACHRGAHQGPPSDHEREERTRMEYLWRRWAIYL